MKIAAAFLCGGAVALLDRHVFGFSVGCVFGLVIGSAWLAWRERA